MSPAKCELVAACRGKGAKTRRKTLGKKVHVNIGQIPVVKEGQYLGVMVDADVGDSAEAGRRMSLAKTAFSKLGKFFQTVNSARN